MDLPPLSQEAKGDVAAVSSLLARTRDEFERSAAALEGAQKELQNAEGANLPGVYQALSGLSATLEDLKAERAVQQMTVEDFVALMLEKRKKVTAEQIALIAASKG